MRKKIESSAEEDGHSNYAVENDPDTGKPPKFVPTANGAKLEYDTRSGQHFVVTVSRDEEGAITEISVKGQHLTIKPEGDAVGKVQAPNNLGETVVKDLEDPGAEVGTAFAANAGLNRAHIIADRFRGSGFRNSQNVIATSDAFNQGDMKTSEDLIALGIRKAGDDVDIKEFELTVTIKLGRWNIKSILSKLPDQSQKHQKLMRERLEEMEQLGIQRVMNIKYTPVIITSKDKRIPLGPYPAIGPDHFGIKAK